MVVLAPYPRRVGHARGCEEAEQLGAEVGAVTEPLEQRGGGVGRHQRVLPGRAGQGPVVDRAVAEAPGGHVGQEGVAVVDPEPPGGRHPPDDTGPDLPPPAEREDLVEVGRRDDGQHPLLALGRHHLDAVHARFPARHLGDVDVHPGAALCRRLRGGTADPRRSQILHSGGQPGVEQGQAGLDQLLFLKGVTDLHGRAFGLVTFLECRRREDARTADSVPSGRRSEQHGQTAFTFGPGQHEALFGKDSETEHIDQRIGRITRIEHDLAADGRHADGIAVTGDTTDHTLDQITISGNIERPESQRIHERRSGVPPSRRCPG